MTEYLDVLFLVAGYAIGWYVHRRPPAKPINVKSFCATGDGVTDDAPAAQAAIDVASEDLGLLGNEEDGRFLVTCGEEVVYCGSSGASARKWVEHERAAGHTGKFFDGDVRRDWWPR